MVSQTPWLNHSTSGNFRPGPTSVFFLHCKFNKNSSGFILNLEICFWLPRFSIPLAIGPSYQHGMTLDESLSFPMTTNHWFLSHLHFSSFMRQGKVVHLAPCGSFHLRHFESSKFCPTKKRGAEKNDAPPGNLCSHPHRLARSFPAIRIRFVTTASDV